MPYREHFPSDAFFNTHILPAIGFFALPVLEAPDGEIVQDTSDIIEHPETKFPEPPLFLKTPVQRTVAMLIDAFASEALLRPAYALAVVLPCAARAFPASRIRPGGPRQP